MGELRSCGIPCTVILDSAVGYVMGEVHCVMLGAEGVAESGGIINKVGIFYYLKYSNGNKHDIMFEGIYQYIFTFTSDWNLYNSAMRQNVK